MALCGCGGKFDGGKHLRNVALNALALEYGHRFDELYDQARDEHGLDPVQRTEAKERTLPDGTVERFYPGSGWIRQAVALPDHDCERER